MQTLEEFIAYWKASGDKPETHQHIYDVFGANVDADAQLKDHRHYCASRALGFGCDQFHWQWKLIVDSMPEHFSMLEIGVHCGMVLSLVEMLAGRSGKFSDVFGVSPFDGRGIRDIPEDFKSHTLGLFEKFNLKKPYLIQGDSTKKTTIDSVSQFAPFDVVYIDGSHTYQDVLSDILHYAPMVKVGCLLVMDDASNRFNLPKCHDGQNHFHGIDPVSQAVDKLLPPFGSSLLPDGSEWEHVAVCMHNRIFRRMSK